MQMTLNSKYLNEAAVLEKRWSKWGLLEGMTSRASGIARPLPFCSKTRGLINEQSTDTGDIAQFKRISIPLVRRIYPQLIANKIVPSSRLLGPTGLVYYLRFRYSQQQGCDPWRYAAGLPGDDALSPPAARRAATATWTFGTPTSSSLTRPDNAGGGTVLQYQLEHTPVLAGTITGSFTTAAS
jgi:hypothetical protein